MTCGRDEKRRYVSRDEKDTNDKSAEVSDERDVWKDHLGRMRGEQSIRARVRFREY
jgi:hypothetical protein